MSIFRKDENGVLHKTSGAIVQRWNDRIFQTTHTVVGDADYYEIESSASKYILTLTDYTEYQLYMADANETTTVYITFKGQELKLQRSSNEPMLIGKLVGKVHCYVLALSTGYIWTDAAIEVQLLGESVKKVGSNILHKNAFLDQFGVTFNYDDHGTASVAIVDMDADYAPIIRLNTDGIYINPNYILTPASADFVPTRDMVDGYIEGHDTSETAHETMREAIESIETDIARLQAIGKPYGEINYENATLLAMDAAARKIAINADIVARYAGYINADNDYVYDRGLVVDGLPTNYHVWKYNSSSANWFDEGIESAISKASNNYFGIVKGNSYISIVAGVMQVLLADNATNLKDSGSANFYTYTSIYNALARITQNESDILALETQISQKVDKVTGKQLSTEDYTTTEKSKLGGITDGAQVNVIEKIKVNGVERPIVLKAVDIYINFDSITEYGVREIVSQSSPTLERVKRIGSDMLIGSATGLVAAAGIDAGTVTNSFDSVSIFQRSRNVLPDGNVFVRVPKYYIKEEWVLDGATNYHYIWMCQSKLAGYRLPLSFAKEDGSENDCYFIGAYEASLGGDSKLKSITGAVTKVSYSRAQFRTAARLNDGLGAASKYQITDIAEYVDLVQIPMMIEFATKNTQLILRGFVDASYTATHLPLLAETAVNRVILTNTQAAAYRVGQMIDIGTSQGGRQVAQDRQIVSITVDTPVAGQSQIIFDGAAVTTTLTQMVYNVSQKTGQCDAVVASSGSKTANDGKNSCIWRGMENPYGNTYKNIDGVKISNNQTWICLFPSLYNDTASVAGDYASPFVKLSYININANGYCVALGYDPLYPFAKFPTSITGGSSVLYFSDYYYQSTGDRTVFVGGYWNVSSYAGPFCWRLNDSLGNADLHLGARLSKRP